MMMTMIFIITSLPLAFHLRHHTQGLVQHPSHSYIYMFLRTAAMM